MVHLITIFLSFIFIFNFSQSSLGNSHGIDIDSRLGVESKRWYLPSKDYQEVEVYATRHISIFNPGEYEKWMSTNTVRMWQSGMISNADFLLPIFPRALLPTKKFHYNRDFGDAIWLDDIWLKVISTPTGSEICRVLTRGSQGILVGRIGLSSKQAFEKFKPYCSDLKGDLFGIFNRNTLNIINNTVSYGSRVHFFVLHGTEQANFNSWTFCVWNDCTRNPTNIVVNLNSYSTENDVIRALAHEWAMLGDSRRKFRNPDIENSLVDQSQICDVRSALAHPQIRIGLATLRAFIVENRIMKELGEKIQAPTLESLSASCVNALQDIMEHTDQFADLFIQEANDQLKYNNSSTCRLSFPRTPMKELLQILEIKTIDSSGSEKSVCQRMLDYLPGFWGDSSSDFHPGPRPNIGDGGGTLGLRAESFNTRIEQNFFLKKQSEFLQPTNDVKSRAKKKLFSGGESISDPNTFKDTALSIPEKGF